MEKVVSSSLIIRSPKSPGNGPFSFLEGHRLAGVATKWQHSRVLAGVREAFFARLPERATHRTFGLAERAALDLLQ